MITHFAPELLPAPHRPPNRRLIAQLQPRDECKWTTDPDTLDFVLERLEIPAKFRGYRILDLCEGTGVAADHLEV